MNEELREIYKERLAAFDPSLVPGEAAEYFGDLFGALSGNSPANEERFLSMEAEKPLGELAPVLWAWYYEALHDQPQREEEQLPILETSIRLLCAFEETYQETGSCPSEKTIRDIVWSYLHDYAEEFTEALFCGPSRRLFAAGDPLWSPLSEKSGVEALHGGDLSLFWGDRLKGRKLEALELVRKERKKAGESGLSLPETFPPSYAKEAVLSFGEHQKNLWKEYAGKAETILHEEV